MHDHESKPVSGDEMFSRMVEAFGQDLIGCYDTVLSNTSRIITGEKDPESQPAERQIEQWAETLDGAGRRAAYLLCERTVNDVLFCLLNHFDHTHLGRHLPRGARYRLLVELPPGTAEETVGRERREVQLNPPVDPFNLLHESLPDWIERFSRFGPPDF